jgi:hypothetical protein
MKRRTRLWIGVTFLTVVFFNYLSVGIPLYKRIDSLEKKTKIFAKNSEDAFIMDVLKKEAASISKKIVMLNRVAASAAIIITSWLIFGLVVRGEDRRKT